MRTDREPHIGETVRSADGTTIGYRRLGRGHGHHEHDERLAGGAAPAWCSCTAG